MISYKETKVAVDFKKELLASIQENVKLDLFVHAMLDKALEPALKALVEDTSTPFDDVLFQAVYPALEAELKKQVSLLWGKLFTLGAEKEELGELV